jgi:hypothetical protein
MKEIRRQVDWELTSSERESEISEYRGLSAFAKARGVSLLSQLPTAGEMPFHFRASLPRGSRPSLCRVPLIEA